MRGGVALPCGSAGLSLAFALLLISGVAFHGGWSVHAECMFGPPAHLFNGMVEILADREFVFLGALDPVEIADYGDAGVVGDGTEEYVVSNSYCRFQLDCCSVLLVVRQDDRRGSFVFALAKGLNVID